MTGAVLADSLAAGPTPTVHALAGAVHETPLDREPFSHIQMRGVFPIGYYLELLANLPPTRCYRELRHPDALRPDGSYSRRKFPLFPEFMPFLPKAQRAFWSHLSGVLQSKSLEDAFKAKFKDDLERRFGCSIDRLSFRPIPLLVRDLSGYRIGLHSDTLSKAITVQFYLPADASQEHLGTCFHYGSEGDALHRIKRMSFLPAAGYAFPVMAEESWHSVPATQDADGERNSLMLTYYVKGSLKDRMLYWRSRLGQFMRYLVQD